MVSWSRKAVGALKNVATMGFGNIGSKIADIDVAIVKATRHNDIPPEEKHVLIAVTATKDRGLRRYLKRIVEDHLKRTKKWMVAAKTLILIHRLIRDALPIFTAENMRHSSDTSPLREVSQSFEDSSTPLALEFSRWVRKYSSYLVQNLQCNKILNHGISAEIQNKTRKLFEFVQLLEDLRSLQLLLDCLLDCSPAHLGPVAVNSLVHYALNLIVKECPEIYAAINSCIFKLLGSFFDMPSDKALSFVDIYKRSLQQYEKLTGFYDACSRVGLTDINGDYPSDKRFLLEMEDHMTKYTQRLSEMDDTRRRYNSTYTEEEHITEKETPCKKETQQDAVQKEKPMVSLWDVEDAVPPRDGVTFRSKTSDQEAKFESNHEVNDWEKALEMSMMGSSSTTNYQSGD